MSHLRIATAIALMSVGAATAFVAATPSGPSLLVKSDNKDAVNKVGRDRDESAGNRRAMPGPERERGPLAAAEEDYAHRAYPALDVPFKLTLDASSAWRAIRARGIRNPNLALTWALAGPSTANFPDVLTFSGTPYTTSGRITAIAVDPACNVNTCRVWVAAAGGGVWRTVNALDPTPTWTFISGSFATNAIGTLTYDAANTTLYAGTGEPNASGDSEAGLGVYKSIDGGDTWTLLAAQIGPITTTSPAGAGGFVSNGTYTGNAFAGRAISSVLVDPTNPNHLYVSSVRAVRGVSSVGGATSNPTTPRPPFGLFQSTDGGATFNFIWDGSDACPATCNGTTAKATVRGVNKIALDPGWNGTTNQIIYGGAFGLNNTNPGAGGVWRSTDAGVTWTQIKTARNAAAGLTTDRAEFAVTPISGGFTRMYVGVGNSSTATANQAHLFRTDDAVTATDASFTDLSAMQDASLAPNQTTNYCTGQCWYDNVVYTPPGKPDVVYLGGSFDYSNYGFRNNGRGFLRSTDAGVTFTDMTWDSTTNPTPANSCCQPNPIAPNGMHPDSHAMVEIPSSDVAIFGSDGGLMRSSGTFSDISPQCTNPRTTLTGANLATCQQLLSSVPTTLSGVNAGLSTLQFQSVTVAADDSTHVQGGTQDNGTFESFASQTWPQIIYGDGGQSGFSSTNSMLRLNTFFGNFHDVNFQSGDPLKWVIASGPIVASGESSLFYPPLIADTSTSAGGTIFEGSKSVWRTQDWAGDQTFLEANCPEFTTSGANPACGDFVPIGPAGATDITASAADYRGTTRSGGSVAFLARTACNTGTLWAATSTGRVFVSKNADDVNTSVRYTRIDSLDANSPGRFITGIYIDSNNPNHAWISYNGYTFNTPTTPGHIFSVTYNPAGPTATWTNLDGSGGTAFPDFPATAIVAAPNGDLYAANDFGVLRLPNGTPDWEVAGTGMPMVEVSGLTISPDRTKIYAATHGRSVFAASLPATPTAVVCAASRIQHDGSGTFDVDLPLTGTPGIECRDGGANNDYTMVVTFAGNVAVTGNGTEQARVTSGSGCVGSGGTCDTNGMVTVSGNVVTIPLTNVADQQTINVTLFGVNSASVDGTSVNVVIPMSRLLGDSNGNGAVNSSDVTQTKSRSGVPTTANFRSDVDASGAFNATDVLIVKANTGHGLP